MKPLILIAAAAAASLAGAAQAQAPTAPPRARAPATALAVEAAMEAIRVCATTNYAVTALVTDADGATVALIGAENSRLVTQTVAGTKVATVLKYKVPSGVIAERVKTDTKLADEIKADPKIGQARDGALPITVGGETIGVMAVSGAPGGDKDLVCTKAGLEKVQARLK